MKNFFFFLSLRARGSNIAWCLSGNNCLLPGFIILGWRRCNYGFGLWVLNYNLAQTHLYKSKQESLQSTHFCQWEIGCLFLKHKNRCFTIPQALEMYFLHPAGCEIIFLTKSCWDAWRSGNQLARGQVNMVDKAKHCSPVCSAVFKNVILTDLFGCCGS